MDGCSKSLLAFSAIAFLLVASTTHAVPGNTAILHQGSGSGTPCGPAPSLNVTVNDDLVQDFNSASGGCTFSVTVVAGGGSVGLAAQFENAIGSAASVPGIGVTARSEIEVNIIQSVYYTGGLVPVGMRADVHGSVSASLNPGSIFVRGTNASLDATASFVGLNDLGLTVRAGVATSAEVSLLNLGGDLFDSELIDETLETNVILIDPTHPIVVTFSLRSHQGAATYSDSSASSTISALNTLGFHTGGPVFILPEGFSASSVDGNIVDNQFVVPLPASMYLFVGAALGAMTRRRAPRRTVGNRNS